MKVVFAGPSLHRAEVPPSLDIDYRAPAFQGDIYDAVQSGANVIGIIDGFFEAMSSVWHKEILFALSEGVQVFGSSSMGALRAAECAPFGMIGIGSIFEAYVDGRLVDDDAVAMTHGPRELSYMPLTVPLVNVIWSLRSWRESDCITEAESDRLLAVARELHFKDRTWKSIVDGTALSYGRSARVGQLARNEAVDQKALDALQLVAIVAAAPDKRGERPHWEFSRTEQFERFLVNRHNSTHAVTTV